MLKNRIKEGIDEFGAPDEKYYAFDWDDNIVSMPTKIILKDEEGDEVGMSTEDFATYREEIGNEPFEFDGHTIVGFAEEPFRWFGVKGDKQFIVDSITAKPAAAWNDFVEAINNGSIFSIITARGHHPDTIKDAIYNLIITNHNGINKDLLVKNLKKYRDIVGLDDKSDLELIREYLELNK